MTLPENMFEIKERKKETQKQTNKQTKKQRKKQRKSEMRYLGTKKLEKFSISKLKHPGSSKVR